MPVLPIHLWRYIPDKGLRDAVTILRQLPIRGSAIESNPSAGLLSPISSLASACNPDSFQHRSNRFHSGNPIDRLDEGLPAALLRSQHFLAVRRQFVIT